LEFLGGHSCNEVLAGFEVKAKPFPLLFL